MLADGVEIRSCVMPVGPQYVTVHGRDEVVVDAAEEFRRLKGGRTAEALVAALRASPYRAIDVAPQRERQPVRDVKP